MRYTVFILILFFTMKAEAQNADSLMQKYVVAGTPGEYHKKLDVFVGNWTLISREWPEGSTGKPIEYKGKAEIKWINDSRFIQMNLTGVQFGQPFTAINLLGYSNIRKKYISTWSDNSSTAFFSTEGYMNEKGDVLTMYGKTDDPGTGEMDKPWRIVWLITKNKLTLQYYDMLQPESTGKMFELVFEK